MPLSAVSPSIPMTLFIEYVRSPDILVAVVFPAILSFIFLARAGWKQEYSDWLGLVYILSATSMYFTCRWEITPEGRSLFILPLFSIYCLFSLWKRQYIPPSLGFALTFFAGWSVDMMAAIALLDMPDSTSQPQDFYAGVGGAGVGDGLFVVPWLTYFSMHYALFRIRGKATSVAKPSAVSLRRA